MSSSNPSVDSNGSNTDTSTNNQNSGSSDFKGDARDSRLLRRNGKEEILRKKLQEEAKKKCADYFQGLAECAKQEGLLVVVKCQRRNKECKFIAEYDFFESSH